MRRHSVYVEKNEYDTIINAPGFIMTKDEFMNMPIMTNIIPDGEYYKLVYDTPDERNIVLDFLKKKLKMAIPLNEVFLK